MLVFVCIPSFYVCINLCNILISKLQVQVTIELPLLDEEMSSLRLKHLSRKRKAFNVSFFFVLLYRVTLPLYNV